MQVNIHNTRYDYSPDYSRQNQAWKFKNTDAFTFSKIGGNPCFIKRFESVPAAQDLILLWRNEPIEGFPLIFDYQEETRENNKNVAFLFLECLSGDTLKESLESGAKIRIERLFEDILAALEKVHEAGFWFTDFNEENIFAETNGDFRLIDLDSCSKLGTLPNADHRQPGGLPGAAQKSACVVVELLKILLHKDNIRFSDLNGRQLNLLQILVLVTTIQIRQQGVLLKKLSKQETDFEAIARYLICKNNKLIEQICEDVLQNKAAIEDIKVMGEFILGFRAISPIIERFEYLNGTIFWQVIAAEKVFLTQNQGNKEVRYKAETKINKRTLQLKLTALGQYGTEAVQVLDILPLPPKPPQKPKWYFKNIFKYINRFLGLGIFIGIFFFVYWAFTKNWPQNRFLSDYRHEIDLAQKLYNEAVAKPEDAPKGTLASSDSILRKLHFDEWLLNPWVSKPPYMDDLNEALGRCYHLHGTVFFAKKDYRSAEKYYKESCFFYEKTSLKDTANYVATLKSISKMLYTSPTQSDSLAQLMQSIESYNPGRFIKTPIMERLESNDFSECNLFKQKNDFRNALDCYLNVRQASKNKGEDKLLNRSIAYCQYQIGLSFFHRKNYPVANKCFASINKKDYDWPIDVDYHMGICQFKMGNYERTLQLLRPIKRGLEIEGYKAIALIELRRYEEACKILGSLKEAKYQDLGDLDVLVKKYGFTCP